MVPESVEMIASSASSHAGLRLFEEGTIRAPADLSLQHLQGGSRVAAQADLDREAQADARRIAVDLYPAAPIVRRVELEVRKTRADHQQRVGLFHRLLRRRGAEQANPAGGKR